MFALQLLTKKESMNTLNHPQPTVYSLFSVFISNSRIKKITQVL